MVSRSSGEPPAGRFLNVAEVAAALRVSRMTVYRLIHAGHLPALRAGTSVRIPVSALEDYGHPDIATVPSPRPLRSLNTPSDDAILGDRSDGYPEDDSHAESGGAADER